MSIRKALNRLRRALSPAPYGKPGNLIHGAPLMVEDLDLSKIGLYSQEQKDALVAAGAPEYDFFLAHEPPRLMGKWGYGYWARRSDENVKWRIFHDSEIKLHKTMVKK